MLKHRYILVALIILFLWGCTAPNDADKRNQAITLTVSAAASLHDVLTEIKQEFNQKHPKIHVNFNFGGSGTLQQQIINGAPVDLYIFADKEKADVLSEKGATFSGTNMDLLSNQLVLIVPNATESEISNIKDLQIKSVKKIAIGTPETVPAGKFAKQALVRLGVWNSLESEEKLIRAKDVRQVLTYVETGNVDAGFVYLTDALESDKVRIVTRLPDTIHDPIIYSTGIVQTTNHLDEAKMFSDYLFDEQAKTVFKEHGFQVLE